MTEQTTEGISKDMLIGDVVMRYPQVADVFLSYGLHCVGCHVNAYETIEQGALGHGMSDEDVDEMVAEANLYLQQAEQPDEDFTATARAVSKLKELAAEEGKHSWGLRVGVDGECCSAHYNLEFEEKPKEGDTILDSGFKLFLDAYAHKTLAGGKLDWVEGPTGAGFKITKNKKHACGHGSCGCSH